MQTPKDPGLFFIVFFSITLPVILFLWLLLPAHVKIGEDEDENGAEKVKILTREDKIIESEAELDKAQEILDRLEKKEKKEEKKSPKTQPPAKKGPEKKVSAQTK
jgi:hypothetical protein